MAYKQFKKTRTRTGQNPDKTPGTDGRWTDTDTPLGVLSRCPDAKLSELENLDCVVSEMEKAWGVDKLRLEVGDELRARFDAQLKKLNAAIIKNDTPKIKKAANAMRRAWWALDGAARAEGKKPAGEAVWVGKHPSGETVCIYTTAASIVDIAEHPSAFHVSELVKFIPAEVLKVKKTFPGSKVSKVQQKYEFDDEIPF